MRYLRRAALILLAALGARCSTAPLAPVAAPEALRVPDGVVLSLKALGSGAQIYRCVASGTSPETYAWKFEAPEATLTDGEGHNVAKHYAGPTWEAPDGSRVTGAVIAQAPSPDSASIAWLLLAAKSTSGLGIFGQARFIRRVLTSGGVTPSASCGSENLQRQTRVAYSAVYEFYTAKP